MKKRAAYDKYGKDAFKDGGGPSMSTEEIFSQFFGSGFSPFGFPSGRQPQNRGPKKTKDMLVELAVTLEDLYNGTTKKMKVTKNVVCSACEGSGSISKKKHTCQNCGGSGVCVLMRQFGPGMITKQQIRCDKCSGEGEAIPFKDRCKSCNGAKVKEERKILPVDIDKGMTDGKKIPMRGEAHEAPGMLPGDLVFILKEQPHPVFQREGVHLFMQKEIPLSNALTGFQFMVTHLDGRKILVKTGPGDILRPLDSREIRNEGMPVYSRPYEHGNLYIKFKVKFPTRLTDQQVSMLRTYLPDLVPAPQHDPEAEEVVMVEVDEAGLKQDRYKTHGGNAYDESDEEEQHGGGNVQCAQQ